MTRILIGAGDLRDILAKNPQVEIELLNSAVPQIAELIRRKAVEKEPSIKKSVEETFHRLMLEQGSRYGLSGAMREVIKVYLAEVWKEEVKGLADEAAQAAARDIAQQAVNVEIKKASRQIAEEEDAARARVDEHARVAAEREVLALLRAGRLLPTLPAA